MAAEEKGKAVGPHSPCIPNSRSKGLGLMKSSKKEKETQQLSQNDERGEGQKQSLVRARKKKEEAREIKQDARSRKAMWQIWSKQ